tara:strand:+ start:9120 stop:11174 length:2055 start_codon:yes stop_codon:yes gene_type:complete
MPKSTVYAVRPDRLGGRLSAIVNAKRLADMFDLDLQVFWSKPKNAYPELLTPEAIFSQDFIDAHFLPEDTVKGALVFTPILKPATRERPNVATLASAGKKTDFTPVLRSAALTNRADFKARIAAGEDFGFTTREGAIPLPFEDKKTAQRGFADAFLRLNFSDEFRATMAHIDTALIDGKTDIGVHIRRGDVIRNQNTSEGFWYGQFVPDVVYFQALDALNTPDTQLILFCDDTAVLKTFRARYPDALSGADICATNNKPALHVDMAEMYLLSRCARIVCPRSSAFSMTAADLSATVHEPVEDLLSAEQMGVAVDALVKQLNQGTVAFHSVGDFKQSLNALVSYYQRGLSTLSPIDIARIARDQSTTTVTVMEQALIATLNAGDLAPLSWLRDMVHSYAVPHVSALGDCFALLAYGAEVVGDKAQAEQDLTWANWLYPESQICGAITSVLAGNEGQFSTHAYASANAKLHFPIHRGLQFLTRGNHSDQFDGLWRHLNYTAGFIMMDWLEFINPKTRRRMLLRSALPRKLDAELYDSFQALDLVMTKRSKIGLEKLQELHAAHPDDPFVTKRLATAYLRMGEVDAGLDLMRTACDLASHDPAFKAAYAIRLVEFKRELDAMVVFRELAALGVDWIEAHPAVITSYAQACLVTKAYRQGFDLIARNLDVARSCKVSLTLHAQLKRYL